ATAGANDHVDLASGTGGTGAGVDTAREVRREGKEAGQKRCLGDLAVALPLAEPGAVHDDDLGTAAGSGAGDDVQHAIAVDVAEGHAHPTRERRYEGKEAGDHGHWIDLTVALHLSQPGAVEHDDLRSATGVGPGDH